VLDACTCVIVATRNYYSAGLLIARSGPEINQADTCDPV